MAKPYDEDLTYIHDVGYGDFATESAPGLLEILRQGGIATGCVVDLGCGSGIWAAELCRAGYDVLGVDISASMLALARKRAPKAQFRRSSYLSAKLPRCDAVTSLGECLNYRFDRNVGLNRLAGLFRRIHDALHPGGLLIFDVRELPRDPTKAPQVHHAEGKDWAVLVRVETDLKTRELTRWITSFRKVGPLYRRTEEVHRLRLYRRSELAAELRKIGFTVRTLRGYGQRRFAEGLAGFVARKA